MIMSNHRKIFLFIFYLVDYKEYCVASYHSLLLSLVFVQHVTDNGSIQRKFPEHLKISFAHNRNVTEMFKGKESNFVNGIYLHVNNYKNPTPHKYGTHRQIITDNNHVVHVLTIFKQFPCKSVKNMSSMLIIINYKHCLLLL